MFQETGHFVVGPLSDRDMLPAAASRDLLFAVNGTIVPRQWSLGDTTRSMRDELRKGPSHVTFLRLNAQG